MSAKNKFKIKNVVPAALNDVPHVDALVEAFLTSLQPMEAGDLVHIFVDARTKARYCECHIPAGKLVPLSTTDVPLDPEDQPEYRANREIVTSHLDFEKCQKVSGFGPASTASRAYECLRRAGKRDGRSACANLA